jgi:hypothetical protein
MLCKRTYGSANIRDAHMSRPGASAGVSAMVAAVGGLSPEKRRGKDHRMVITYSIRSCVGVRSINCQFYVWVPVPSILTFLACMWFGFASNSTFRWRA